MPKSLRLRPLLLGLAFCTLLSGLVRGFQQPERISRKMRDGSTVTLEGVTLGEGELRFATGNRFERWLGANLPLATARRLGLHVGISVPPEAPHAEGSHLVAWFTLKPSPVDGFTSWGAVLPTAPGRAIWTDANPEVKAGPIPIPIRIRCFPRRGARVRLRLWHNFHPNGRPETRTEADFDLHNPAPSSFPAWEPSPLPATQAIEDLEVTLLELETGKVWWSPPKSPETWGTRIGVRAKARAGKASEWRIGEIVVSDATENRHSFGWLRAPYLPGRDGVSWRVMTGEFPLEPVWKVAVRLVRNRDTPRLAEFRGVLLPKRGKTRRFNLRRPIHGGALVLDQIFPDESWFGEQVVVNGRPVPTRGDCYRFRGEGIPGEENICVARVECGALEEAQSCAIGDGVFHFAVPAASRTVDISVERHFPVRPPGESRTVEFIVRPKTGDLR